jgi:hypothetical protein
MRSFSPAIASDSRKTSCWGVQSTSANLAGTIIVELTTRRACGLGEGMVTPCMTPGLWLLAVDRSGGLCHHMTMRTAKIFRNGRSLAVRIPMAFARETGLEEGSEVDVELRQRGAGVESLTGHRSPECNSRPEGHC